MNVSTTIVQSGGTTWTSLFLSRFDLLIHPWEIQSQEQVARHWVLM